MSHNDWIDLPLTEEEKALYAAARKLAHAEIGKLAILRTRINERIKGRTKLAEAESGRISQVLRAGSHDVQVRVEIDLYEDRARMYRLDNGAFVRSRPLRAAERQQNLNFDAGPIAGSSGKRADEPAPATSPASDGETEAPQDPPVETPAGAPEGETLLDEIMRIVKGPIDVAQGLIQQFGPDGARRVTADIESGKSASEAFAAEEERQRKAAGKPKKKGDKKKAKDAPAPASLCRDCGATGDGGTEWIDDSKTLCVECAHKAAKKRKTNGAQPDGAAAES